MKQYPSRLKFKKYHKINSSLFVQKEKKLFFPTKGLFGLKSLECGKITFKKLEAGRRSIRRTTKKVGVLNINNFTSHSITKKPLASRMGKGKGNHSIWVSPVRKGQIIYELSGIGLDVCYKALLQAGSKLPFRTKVVKLCF